MRRVLIVVTIASLVAAMTPAGRAQDSFDCGEVIEESIRLRHSLANCAEHGLVIGASGIEINLGGETLDGTGEGAGILNEKGYRDVLIRNGTITGFEQGVLIESPQDTANTITDLELSENEVAVHVDGAGNNEISDNEIFGNDEGIAVSGDDNLIDNNEIFDEQPAIAVEGDQNEIVDNEVDHSVAGPDETAPSIVLEGDGNILDGNEILAGEVGIEAAGDDNLFTDNELEGGAGHGIVFEGDDNEVRENDVERYGDVGIYLKDGSGNLIIDNDVEDSEDEGILVEADETRIEGNGADDNGADGISVDADDARIVGNDADDNGFDDGEGYGILADGEGIEGSDNDASGNANPRECLPAILCD